jgi:hypothetical protein
MARSRALRGGAMNGGAAPHDGSEVNRQWSLLLIRTNFVHIHQPRQLAPNSIGLHRVGFDKQMDNREFESGNRISRHRFYVGSHGADHRGYARQDTVSIRRNNQEVRHGKGLINSKKKKGRQIDASDGPVL